MERYIGMDVHSTCTTCVVISPAGRKSKEAVIETRASALRDFVRAVRRPRVVVMEEGNQSDWLYEVLSPHADEVLVIQPERSSGRKNDRLDAERQARLARLNEPGRLVFKAPRVLQELRHATKSYLTTKRDLTRARARLKLLLQPRGLLVKPSILLEADGRNGCIESLPEAIQPRAVLLGKQIDACADLHEQAESWMLKQGRNVRAVRWVKSVPGIGDVRAAAIVATIVSPHRFRTKRQLWSYAGLGVVVRSSNDYTRKGDSFVRRHRHGLVLGLNRNRNPVLKEAFVGAAQHIINQMPNHPLHQAYQQRIERGMKPSSARLTLARAIAAIVLAIWKKEQPYDPSLS